jgi:3-methyladenine DNA glycosylase/8-oxoguanine DNA glycosylase
MEITIKTLRDFNFRRTVLSHGWCALQPFEFDQQSWTLIRVLDPGQGAPVTVEISSSARAINVKTSRQVGKKAVAEIERDVRHMFRLDDDLREFYQTVTGDPDFAWVAHEGAGRLLRSPTVFEDLVKMICTTNCSWALTEKMVSGLVNELGRESADGRRSFPGAAAMAEKPARFFRDQIRSGYRAPYLAEL